MRICAKNDLLFKMIFGDPNHNGALVNLLQSILDIPRDEYEDIKIVDPNLKIKSPLDKRGILDIKLNTKSGGIIDVELQVRESADMDKRVLFYASKMISEQISSGEEYEKIKKVISIIICTDHNMIKDSKGYHNRYFLIDEKTGSKFTDVLEIDVIEFLKLPKADNSDLATWLKFLNANSEEELEMVAKSGTAFSEAVCRYKELTNDEATRMILEEREKAWKDERARLKFATQKGRAEGKVEGRNEREIEIARNLLNMCISVEQIEKATGLSREEIEKLKLN